MLPNQLSTENLDNWMIENEFSPYQRNIIFNLKNAGFDYQPMLTDKFSVGYSDMYNLLIRGNHPVDVIQKSTLTDYEMSIIVAYIFRTYDLTNIQSNGDQYNLTIEDIKLTVDKELFDIASELRTKNPF